MPDIGNPAPNFNLHKAKDATVSAAFVGALAFRFQF